MSTKRLEEDFIELKHHQYKTPIYETREECWQDLHNYLDTHAKWNLVFLRESPQVYSEKEFDTKKVINRGFVRFSVSPVKYDNTLTIPSIGDS